MQLKICVTLFLVSGVVTPTPEKLSLAYVAHFDGKKLFVLKNFFLFPQKFFKTPEKLS